MLWKPKWKKEGKLTLKGANKFVNYKKDLLEEQQIKSIRDKQDELKQALKDKDKEAVKETCKLLEQECKKSLRSYVRPNAIAENTEVFFVAIVIALGLRAYYLQPFRIPTGSMQPTLNGINAHVLPKDEWPSLPKRLSEWVTHGRSYVYLVSEEEDTIMGIEQKQRAKFFTVSTIYFANQDPITVSASASALQTLGIKKNRPCEKGEVIAQGFVETGDTVLVDKVSYHFRKPRRGETFVFDTRNIDEVHKAIAKEVKIDRNGRPIETLKMIDQTGGAHYIKRCVGLPGDTLSIDFNGNVLIDGKIADDKGLIYSQGLTYNRAAKGYKLADRSETSLLYSNPMFTPDDKLVLAGEENRQMAEYAAFGDNTENSLDSRYWGTVKQYNLVGPALFSLWPFSHEIDPHWGFIK